MLFFLYKWYTIIYLQYKVALMNVLVFSLKFKITILMPIVLYYMLANTYCIEEAACIMLDKYIGIHPSDM